MARKLDFDNLSHDDFQYLSERTWLISDQVLSGNTGLPQQIENWRNGVAESEEETIQYKDGTVAELRAELERRGLDTDGKKPELVARLEADDADTEDDEDDNIPEED